jgi:hypothetical protein
MFFLKRRMNDMKKVVRENVKEEEGGLNGRNDK